MKKIFYYLVSLSYFFAFTVLAASAPTTPIGYWKTVDDVNGKVQSIVQIGEGPHKMLLGTIVKTFPGDKKNPLTHCTACSGDRRDQPIVGLVIMENLKQSDHNTWKNGEILDPRSGKTYSCSIRLVDNNQKLHVRGYIGIPLLGRSQTWLRASAEEFSTAKNNR